MGSSFVEFRGCAVWVKDWALQAAMFLLYREIEKRSDLSRALDDWRRTLMEQAVWAGGGSVWVGLQDYPDDQPSEPLVEVVRSAQQTPLPTARELAQAGIGMAGCEGGEAYWQRLEDGHYLQTAVPMVLAAFMELVSGEVDPRYGRLVHGAESNDVHHRTLPGDDVRVTRSEGEKRFAALVDQPFASSSFGPDTHVKFVKINDDGSSPKQ
jgi:hypothetical protein